MSQVLSEGKGLVAAVQSLSRVAQIPQRKRGIAEASHPRVLTIHKGLRVVLLTGIQGDALFSLPKSRGHFSEPQQGRLQRHVGLKEERRVLYALGQPEKLLPELARRPVFRSYPIKHP
jgi:hypothetical protein